MTKYQRKQCEIDIATLGAISAATDDERKKWLDRLDAARKDMEAYLDTPCMEGVRR